MSVPSFQPPSRDQVKFAVKVGLVLFGAVAAGLAGSQGFDLNAAFLYVAKQLTTPF